MRTTPFPDIIRLTPAPGVYPGFTTSPEAEEEIVGGEIVTLSPLPIPPSVTDTYTKVTHVGREPGLELTDAAMAPTGEAIKTAIKPLRCGLKYLVRNEISSLNDSVFTLAFF